MQNNLEFNMGRKSCADVSGSTKRLLLIAALYSNNIAYALTFRRLQNERFETIDFFVAE